MFQIIEQIVISGIDCILPLVGMRLILIILGFCYLKINEDN